MESHQESQKQDSNEDNNKDESTSVEELHKVSTETDETINSEIFGPNVIEDVLPSISDNSDVWKGSDSEDENPDKEDEAGKEDTNTEENPTENEANDKEEKAKQNPEKAEASPDPKTHDNPQETRLKDSPVKILENILISDNKSDDEPVPSCSGHVPSRSTTPKPHKTSPNSPVKNKVSPKKENTPEKAETSPESSDPKTDTNPQESNEQETKLEDSTLTIKDHKLDDEPVPSCSGHVPNRSTTPETHETSPNSPSENKVSPEKETTSDTQSEVVISSDEVDEDYDDFDPSLLCPEVSMDVDERQVITSNDNASPLPYEPLFSETVDEVTGAEILFNLTPKEEEMRKRLYGKINPIENTRIHCTACNVHLGSDLAGQSNRFVHPLLKVLICRDCYNFYMSGEFEKDEDGSELYCRWCGQGGQVLCCSKCERVFCKKCIRINFGNKRVAEIRDSDEWTCFKCDLTQITNQRVACAEFFDYIKRTTHIARELNNPFFHQNDMTSCCKAKRALSSDEEREVTVPKKRRYKQKIDPDYNPLAQRSNRTYSGVTPPAMPPLVPKPNMVRNIVTAQNPPMLRPLMPGRFVVNPATPPGTMYRTVIPNSVNNVRNATPTLVRLSNSMPYRYLPTQARAAPPQVRVAPPQNKGVVLKPVTTQYAQDWFNKTVRATANVNSQLSFSLTQLSRTAASSQSVHDMAQVHNKFQEILSGSINSLIQIRKNLRSEFIAGIKKKKPEVPVKTAGKKDDDVIFVSAPSTPIFFINSPTNTLAKAGSSGTVTTSTPINSRPVLLKTVKKPTGVVGGANTFLGGGYVTVKSIQDIMKSALMPECITIPDDSSGSSSKGKESTVVSEDKESSASVVEITGDKTEAESTSVEKGSVGIEHKEQESPSGKTEEVVEENVGNKVSKVPEATTEICNKGVKDDSKTEENKENDVASTRPVKMTRKRKFEQSNKGFHYNIKDDPSPEIKRMCAVEVRLERLTKIDTNSKRISNGHRSS